MTFTPYNVELEQATLENHFFRKVLTTQANMQLVLMCLKPGEDIGVETHPDNDQFFRIEWGEGEAIIAGVSYPLKDGSTVVIPKGTEHNIINKGDGELHLYTIYAPAHHPDGTIHETKEIAMEAMRLAGHKLPIKTKFVVKEDNKAEGGEVNEG